MKKAKIEISDVSKGVYEKIAEWHNDEEPATVQNIAILSNEIVEYVLAEAFNQDINENNTGVEMGPDGQKKMFELFKKNQEKGEEKKEKGLFSFFGKK